MVYSLLLLAAGEVLEERMGWSVLQGLQGLRSDDAGRRWSLVDWLPELQ